MEWVVFEILNLRLTFPKVEDGIGWKKYVIPRALRNKNQVISPQILNTLK